MEKGYRFSSPQPGTGKSVTFFYSVVPALPEMGEQVAGEELAPCGSAVEGHPFRLIHIQLHRVHR